MEFQGGACPASADATSWHKLLGFQPLEMGGFIYSGSPSPILGCKPGFGQCLHGSWVSQCEGYITVYIPAGLANVAAILQCTLHLGWLMQIPYYNAQSSQVDTGAIL
jgi:hypothetical protein